MKKKENEVEVTIEDGKVERKPWPLDWAGKTAAQMTEEELESARKEVYQALDVETELEDAASVAKARFGMALGAVFWEIGEALGPTPMWARLKNGPEFLEAAREIADVWMADYTTILEALRKTGVPTAAIQSAYAAMRRAEAEWETHLAEFQARHEAALRQG